MSNCAEAVFKYLQNQNRPYSATDVMQNLHKEFGKTAIQKALDQLAEDGRILGKTYGKQKVYCALQQDCGTKEEMAKELDALNLALATTTDKLRGVEQKVRESEATLKDLESTPTTAEAIKEVTMLEEQASKLRDKLAFLSKNSVQVRPEEREEFAKERERYLKEFRKRKRICNEMLEAILEGYPKPKKALIEDVGIETDEDVGVNLK